MGICGALQADTADELVPVTVEKFHHAVVDSDRVPGSMSMIDALVYVGQSYALGLGGRVM